LSFSINGEQTWETDRIMEYTRCSPRPA
jgi:hypothetical protein